MKTSVPPPGSSFGNKDGGKSFGYLNAPLVMYHNGIEQSARNYLKTAAR